VQEECIVSMPERFKTSNCARSGITLDIVFVSTSSSIRQQEVIPMSQGKSIFTRLLSPHASRPWSSVEGPWSNFFHTGKSFLAVGPHPSSIASFTSSISVG
jgi:hypothetical protein